MERAVSQLGVAEFKLAVHVDSCQVAVANGGRLEIEIYMNVPRHLMTSFEVLENGRKAILETDMVITAGVCVEINVSVTNRKLLTMKVLILREVSHEREVLDKPTR